MYCDSCKYLKPKENEQTNKKESHYCIKYNIQIKHLGQHPRLPRPEECNLED